MEILKLISLLVVFRSVLVLDPSLSDPLTEAAFELGE